MFKKLLLIFANQLPYRRCLCHRSLLRLAQTPPTWRHEAFEDASS
jgi:hypothetical protein